MPSSGDKDTSVLFRFHYHGINPGGICQGPMVPKACQTCPNAAIVLKYPTRGIECLLPDFVLAASVPKHLPLYKIKGLTCGCSSDG